MKRDGFTLIELSIALVIIGLLVGGILTGRALIEEAAMRATLKEIEQYNTAVNIFRIKYNCMPGTCNNATSFLPGSVNGDGSNLWSYTVGNADRVFEHLSIASLVGQLYSSTTPGIGTQIPSTRFSKDVGIWGIKSDESHFGNIRENQFVLGKQSNWAPNNYNYSAFTSTQALMMDTKADNGIPSSGKVLGMNGPDTEEIYACTSAGTGSASNPPRDFYNPPDGVTYNTSTEQPSCRLWFILR